MPVGILAFIPFQHMDVILIPAWRDVVGLIGGEHGAIRLVHVRAVMVFTALPEREDLREIVADLVPFHVDEAKSTDARRVNQVAPEVQGMHFSEGGRMPSLPMRVRDFARFELQARLKRIGQCALPHPGVAREKGDLVLQEGLEFGKPLARHR